MVPKNPVLAVILNLIIPGLGCAYLGHWLYAVIFFFWVPLAYLASPIIVGLVAALFSDETLKSIASIVILLLWIFRIMYEQVSIPYNLAKEINQRIEVQT